MNINERICLIVDDCIFVARHQKGFTFVGGAVNNKRGRVGETCMRELEEELGIRIPTKNPKILSYYVENNKIHILFQIDVKHSEIEFTKASHVWEISGFTLIPTNNKCNPEKTVEFIIHGICAANPRMTYVSIIGNTIMPISQLPEHLSNIHDNVFMDNSDYYVKLTPNPQLTQNERNILKQVNLIVNGIDDELFVFHDDVLCELKYIEYRKFMYLQLSTKSITQIGEIGFTSDIQYQNILTPDEFKKSLVSDERIRDDIVMTLKSIVSSVKRKLHDIGIKNVGNTSFYYMDSGEYCCIGDMEKMFDDVGDYEFIKPISMLSKYFAGSKPNYYEYILQKNAERKLVAPLYIYDFDYELDEILLQYVKCIDNLSIMIAWPVCNISDIYKAEFVSELSKHGNIHAIKEIVVTQKQLCGILYQVYYNKSVFKKYEVIKSKAERCGTGNSNRIFIIYYKATDVKQITGTDAPLKVSLRKLLKRTSGNTKDLKDNMFLHVSDKHSETVELSQLFCNKNSMRLLQYQRLDRLLRGNFWKSLMFLMTFKSWMYSNFKPVDHIRFMLFSSMVLYTLGLRNVNDVDILVHYLPTSENSRTPKFFDIVHTYLENDNTKFPFVVDGASIKGRNGWVEGGTKEYLIDWFEKEWPNMFGAQSMDDIILNPRFHYYYFGIKIVSLEGDTKRRIQRSRPAAYADLLAMQQFITKNVEIPKIPTGYWKNHVYYEFTRDEKHKLIKNIIYYLKSRYSISKNYDELADILL